MEASSATTSFLWKLQEVKKQYNITSWTEMGLIGVTCYLILSFLFSIVIGVGLPFASIVGLGGVGFCSYQVFLLAALSERLKEYEKQNNEYEKLNGSLEERVGEFVKQNGELKRVTDGLRGENERFGEEVVRLRGVVDGLELVEKTIKEFGEGEEEALGDVVEGLRGAIEGGKEVLAQQEGILKSTEETTQTQEKALLLTLHSQCQFLDKNMGMSQKEFETFLTMLPEKFRNNSDFSFEALDKDKSGTIDVQEFQSMVDQIVKAN